MEKAVKNVKRLNAVAIAIYLSSAGTFSRVRDIESTAIVQVWLKSLSQVARIPPPRLLQSNNF